MKEKEVTMYQNLWDTVKTVLREIFIVANSYLKKSRKFSSQ